MVNLGYARCLRTLQRDDVPEPARTFVLDTYYEPRSCILGLFTQVIRGSQATKFRIRVELQQAWFYISRQVARNGSTAYYSTTLYRHERFYALLDLLLIH